MPLRILLVNYQIAAIIGLSGILTTIQTFSQEFIFADWQYLTYLGVIFTVDTVTGFMKAYKRGNVSSKGWGQVIKKMVIYFCVLILAHVLTHFKIGGETSPLFVWVDDFAYTSLLIKEAISILENIAAINPAWVPDRLLKYLKKTLKDQSNDLDT